MNEMIKHGLVPDIEHPVCFKHLLEAMCPKGTERDGEKTKQRCDPKQWNRHLDLVSVISNVFDASPTCFSEIAFRSRKEDATTNYVL